MSLDDLRNRRLSRHIPPALASLALVALIAGCGSSSESASPTTASSSSPTSAAATTAPPTTAATSSSSAIPTEDVVSGIREDPTLHAELPATVQSSGSLILGTTYTPGTSGLPHVGQLPDGTNVGLDVDIRNAVANILGVKWQVQNGTFTTIIPGVQNGKFDVGQDNFGVTAAREQVVNFSTYLNDGQAFLGGSAATVNQITTLTDICGQSVATGAGTTFQEILTEGASACAKVGKKPFTVQYFADTAPIVLGLQNGSIDLYFGPTLSVVYDAAHIPGTKYLGQIHSTPVGFVTAKSSALAPVLTAAVNELISDGDYAKIFAKWNVGSYIISQSQVNPSPNL